MATKLSKAQVLFLSRAMRNGGVSPHGAQWLTADRLVALGFAVRDRNGSRAITPAGLKALRDHRAAVYAKSGSVASMRDLDEVEQALAAQVQPMKPPARPLVDENEDKQEVRALPADAGPGHSAEPEPASGLGPDGRVSHSAGHTPGPWRLAHSGFDRKPCVTARAMTGAPFTVADVTEEDDARLIAAAPEMLQALHYYADQLCEGWCEKSPDCAHFEDCGGCLARRVAFKATGAA